MARRKTFTPEPRPVSAKAPKERDLGDLAGAPRRLLNWRLDWRAYFRRFCELHGGNPVEVDGRLLFADGWSYSSTSYEGPEYPPPSGPAKAAAVLRYWQERRGIVAQELKLLRETKRSMAELMVNRSAPVMKRARREDEGGRKRLASEELSLDAVNVRIAWLEADLAFAADRVRELEGGDGRVQEQDDGAAAAQASCGQ